MPLMRPASIKRWHNFACVLITFHLPSPILDLVLFLLDQVLNPTTFHHGQVTTLLLGQALALVDFLYATGCRVSEVARLDISDVDFERMECVVLGKGNKERKVYLTEVAAMHLQEYLNTRTDACEALFAGRGKRLENAHPHRYRRTLATNLLDRGMNIQDVAAILGHADLKTTQIYCYISQANVKTAYRKYAA